MLLNNFKPLLLFTDENSYFTNVKGNSVDIKDILQASRSDYIIAAAQHNVEGVVRSFDYTTTSGTNSYTDEQTSYKWTAIISNVQSTDKGVRYNGFVLFVGSGNTAVTADDYKLDTALNLTVTAASCACNGDGKILVSRTFKNTTGSDVTIKELGLYLFAECAEGYEIPVIMLGRKVLSTPLVIPNGEQRTFEYVIDMNHISFSEADS